MNFLNDNFVQRRLKAQSRNSRAMMEARAAQQQASANVVEGIRVVGKAVGNTATSIHSVIADLINETDKKIDREMKENE